MSTVYTENLSLEILLAAKKKAAEEDLDVEEGWEDEEDLDDDIEEGELDDDFDEEDFDDDVDDVDFDDDEEFEDDEDM